MGFCVPSEGGCQCGETRYRITGQPVWLTICHCNECKRQSGSAFGMSLRMLDTDVQLIQGALKRWSRSADSGGLVICYFCETCGTRLWHEPAGSGFLHDPADGAIECLFSLLPSSTRYGRNFLG
jgi:hypothetical protein